MSINLPRALFNGNKENTDPDILFSVCLGPRNAKHPDPFNEEWWMDAATNGNFEILEIRHAGVLRLSMPLFLSKRMGFTCIGMPIYTRTLGPTFYLPPSKPFKHAQNVRNLIEELVGRLPRHDSIRIRLPPGDESTFGFSLQDFSCEEQFTFRVPYPSDIQAIWKNCDQKTRNVIRSAQQQVSVEYGYDFSDFVRLSLLNKSEKENKNDFQTMERIFNAARARNQAVIVTARNRDGKSVAAVIIVWGAVNAYFWQSARDLSCGVGGVNALLLWKSIELADRMGLTFDFDSYGSVSSAKFLAGFGLSPLVRTEVSRQIVPYKLFKLANGMMLKRAKAGAELRA
ncbi:GNAT family N-acetyltransferase [Gluconacetobacter asukensis]|uniref:GNAT family N-acetyltransferase n=1 Tax=Gluconacetobacter asukensis TaxID=1017181 RepID=A0A7W4IYA3_9PROT|nr:GNAT family N-acetyltransferase [Gluconacetobacter asukensis]MBB2170957.1 GNAT family N-acetyltransferase [Gluconacetobacter asukensis]